VLDIVEFIALRLKRADDDQVFNLALFISSNLAAFVAGTIAYADLHARLTRTALAAQLGPAEFWRSLNFG
jgi:enoyl-[acyl-carrier-protein] reductase (NADH)